MINFCCPKCDARYRLPEGRAGEKFNCGKCDQRLQIPATPPSSPPPPSTALGGPVVRINTLPNTEARPLVAAPPPKSSAPARTRPDDPAPKATTGRDGKEWYYEYKGEVVGPVPEKNLRAAAENDTLAPEARVWTEGLIDWQPAIAVLPRVFKGLDSEPGFGVQKTLAVVLATIAFASVVGLGGVYWSKNRKSVNPSQPDVVKSEPRAPISEPVKPNPVAPKIDPNLNAAQIMAQFGPSVARVRTSDGSGSGFLARPNLVVTNAHVVESALSSQFRVSFPSGPRPEEQFDGTLVYEDTHRDLAILEVRTSFSPLRLATDAVKGEDVVVIGSPGTVSGKVADNSVTKGILSAKDEEVFGHRFHRIDAAINPGNSGGPAFNSRGQVLGVATMYLLEKQQMNYIVPFADVEKALATVKGYGAAEVFALAKRHDSKSVAVRMMAGMLLDDTIQKRYVAAMDDAEKEKRSHLPGVRAVKTTWLGRVQPRVDRVVTPSVIETANRLAGTGTDAADVEMRDNLRKLIALFDESRKLATTPDDDSVATYRTRFQELNKQFNELTGAIPKGLGTTKAEFQPLVDGMFKASGGDALSPDP